MVPIYSIDNLFVVRDKDTDTKDNVTSTETESFTPEVDDTDTRSSPTSATTTNPPALEQPSGQRPCSTSRRAGIGDQKRSWQEIYQRGMGVQSSLG